MNLNKLKDLIGIKASYDFFGMPPSTPGKTGQGKIIHIETIITEDYDLVSFVLDTKRGIERVPNSCITKFHKKRK